ncbi:orotate phosphoribosyltransferase [uncultured Sphaerochaeta sp.]|uniref:orotate phosphoribosyltransferase n=1 Tax=uncultured Sphaerochaeta sp. TaxID=886478 RepID=UPI0029CA6E37|nr:orotate phosphoribosyltransferase [uncultured Sphaerochaeta sp.]
MKHIEDITNHYGPILAKKALELGAIRLQVQDPFTWASGYRMPIYNDNRRLLAESGARRLVSEAFAAMLESLDFNPDNIAGTATAGIPHATTLADRLEKPMSYVRSSGKDHGLGQQIEGLGQKGTYAGAKVLLIEDLISTGGSSIKAVQAIAKAEGVCPYTLAIFTYGFATANEAFASLDPACTFFTILDYDVMVASAQETGYVNSEEARLLTSWREDPFGWGEKLGFSKVDR